MKRGLRLSNAALAFRAQGVCPFSTTASVLGATRGASDPRPTLRELEQRVFGCKPRLLNYLLSMPSASRTRFGANVEVMRCAGLSDDDIVARMYSSAAAMELLRRQPLAQKLGYYKDVVGVGPRSMLTRNFEVLYQDLTVVDRKVHMLESKGTWDGIRGGYLDWAMLCPRKFCSALGYTLAEFEALKGAWASSLRAQKYQLSGGQ